MVRKEKSLKSGNVCVQTMLFSAASQSSLVARYCLINEKIDYYFQLTVSYDMSLRKIICSFHQINSEISNSFRFADESETLFLVFYGDRFSFCAKEFFGTR